MRLFLDTHAILWAMGEPARLGDHARNALRGAAKEDLLLSDMSLLEISMLATKGRMTCADGVLSTLRAIEDRVTVLRVNASIATRAMELKLPHGDPFDRVIVASALEVRLPLCTRDRMITKSGLVRVVWS
jgi:PIN domain nuclease of toxin-antitoxin system